MSGQNTSPAVMAQRTEHPESLDDFPTPPWAARALCHYVLPSNIADDDCLEPAVNRGFLQRGLGDYFRLVNASDIHDYGIGAPLVDFIGRGLLHVDIPGHDWVITNPPFKVAEEFIMRAAEVSTRGFAMFVRSNFAEGMGRYERLFSRKPPTVIAYFAERPILHRGVLRDPDKKYQHWDEKEREWVEKKPSTATAYCWFVWIHGEEPRAPFWIPPCRDRLDHDGDYDMPEGVR